MYIQADTQTSETTYDASIHIVHRHGTPDTKHSHPHFQASNINNNNITITIAISEKTANKAKEKSD